MLLEQQVGFRVRKLIPLISYGSGADRTRGAAGTCAPTHRAGEPAGAVGRSTGWTCCGRTGAAGYRFRVGATGPSSTSCRSCTSTAHPDSSSTRAEKVSLSDTEHFRGANGHEEPGIEDRITVAEPHRHRGHAGRRLLLPEIRFR